METAFALRPPRPRRLPSSSPHLLLVANANASGLAGRRDVVDGVARLLRVAGGRVEARVTSSIEELAVVVSEEERRLALLGGDGSVHAVANIPGAKPELALLPAGKANNLAHGLGVPTDLRAAAALAVAGQSRPVDAIVASSENGRHIAVEGVSVGFHALARSRYHGKNSADVAAGLAAAGRALAAFHPVTLAVASDGHAEVMRVGQLFVVNFPLYGPGLRVAPGADPADGLLDVVAIEAAGRASLLTAFARLRRGTHLELRGVRHWQARRVRIATGGRSPIIADTTDLGSGPVELSVERAALDVVAPQS